MKIAHILTNSMMYDQEPSEFYSTKKYNFDFEVCGIAHNQAMDFVGNAPRFQDMSCYESY